MDQDASLNHSGSREEFGSCELQQQQQQLVNDAAGSSCSSSVITDASCESGRTTDSSEDAASFLDKHEVETRTSPDQVRAKDEEASEIEVMKERFARLLLGEDMSGCGKGVNTAQAISNAITNLSASIFGNLWRLEPLPPNNRKMWKREMDWLLSVTDHIFDLVPTWQSFPDGTKVEVMIGRPRSDLQINLPALRKLDMMLLQCLDSFRVTEFWYTEQEHTVCSCKATTPGRDAKQEAKWWLPVPQVPCGGLSEEARKSLTHQKECTGQIFKAATAINAQVLLEMEVPDAYLDGLPKNGKVMLGELYRYLSSEDFSPEAILSNLEPSDEFSLVQLADRVEASIHIWHHKLQSKLVQGETKVNASWVMVKEFVANTEKKSVLVERAERLLVMLRQKFPGMPQTLLDVQKIQYNKDIGQAILECYSRVLEGLAFNIIARIDGVLSVDAAARASSSSSSSCKDEAAGVMSSSSSTAATAETLATATAATAGAAAATAAVPSLSKDSSRRQRSSGMTIFSPGKTLADYMKLDPFSKRLYAATSHFEQWRCSHNNSQR